MLFIGLRATHYTHLTAAIIIFIAINYISSYLLLQASLFHYGPIISCAVSLLNDVPKYANVYFDNLKSFYFGFCC